MKMCTQYCSMPPICQISTLILKHKHATYAQPYLLIIKCHNLYQYQILPSYTDDIFTNAFSAAFSIYTNSPQEIHF